MVFYTHYNYNTVCGFFVTLRGMKKTQTKDLWKEGEYVDLWSMVHFLVGMIAGFVPIFFNISFVLALVIFSVLIGVWGIMKLILRHSTFKVNSFLDAVIGATGFASTTLVISFGYTEQAVIESSFIGIVLSIVILSIRGWFVYRMKTRLR